MKIILAPLRGITTVHYRQAFTHHFGGIDAAMAPFVSTVNSERINPKLLKDLLPENNPELPLIPQLIGNNAADFVRMSKSLYELGFDEINLNMGCPHKPIRKKKRGSGLLPHPDFMDQFLETICTESPCKISVKVRLGISSPQDLFNLIPILNKHPLTEVTIHPRTAEQMYKGSVDIDAFDTAYQKIKHPVCYNGDLNNLPFLTLLKNRFPKLDRFMLGRGLLANPFLAEEIQSNTFIDSTTAISRITTFHNELLERYESVLYGDQPVLGKMKEFWTHAALHLSNGRKLFKKIKKTTRISTYRAIIKEQLAESEWIHSNPKPDPQ